MADELENLELEDRLFLALDMSPRLRAVLAEIDQREKDDWTYEFLVALVRAAFGSGLVAAQREPELIEALESLGYQLKA